MRAYGVNRRDQGCCPGHDTFPVQTYRNPRSKRAQARDTKIAHQVARARAKRATQQAVRAYGQDQEAARCDERGTSINETRSAR
jgi:hypothetical protein